jgi:hypothetical protein
MIIDLQIFSSWRGSALRPDHCDSVTDQPMDLLYIDTVANTDTVVKETFGA